MQLQAANTKIKKLQKDQELLLTECENAKSSARRHFSGEQNAIHLITHLERDLDAMKTEKETHLRTKQRVKHLERELKTMKTESALVALSSTMEKDKSSNESLDHDDRQARYVH